jgi:hypothetical protein
MGKKSEERAARIAAAQKRDSAIVEAARRDPFLLDWMRQSRELNPMAFAQAVSMAKREARRPSSPDRDQALVALGGMIELGLVH